MCAIESYAALDLTIDQKRQVIAMFQSDYPKKRLCQVLALPRSTAYYHACPSDEQPLQATISAVAAQYPTYGSRRVAKQLARAPYRQLVNRKRAQRIMRQLGLVRTRRRRVRRTTNSQHRFGRFPNLVAERTAQAPDDIWVSDLTYVHLGVSFIYLAIIMDIFTRDIRGWQLSRTLAQELTTTALRRALAQHTPRIHQSDQGIQYAAPQYVQLLEQAGVQISMAAVGEPTQNGFADRVMRTITKKRSTWRTIAILMMRWRKSVASSTMFIEPSASIRRLAIWHLRSSRRLGGRRPPSRLELKRPEKLSRFMDPLHYCLYHSGKSRHGAPSARWCVCDRDTLCL